MFFAWRDLLRSWRRFVLVGVVVALVAILSTVLAGLADGLVRDGTSGLRALPLDHLAFAPGSQSVFSRSTLDGDALAAWEDVPGAEVSPVGVSFVNAAPVDEGPSLDLALFGVPADSFLVERAEAQEALAGEPGLVLASELQEDGVEVGDESRLAGTDETLPVLGFTFAGSYGHVPLAYTSLDTWQAVTFGNDPRGRFSALGLDLSDVPPGTDLTAVDAAAGTETVTKAEAYNGSPGFTAETATMSLIRGFLVVISALVVGAFFTVLAVQRTRQIGLLKAMGASSRYVLVDAVGQMLVVVALATAAGTALGAAVTALLAGGAAPIDLTLSGTVSTALVLVVAGLIGSVIPFRRITKVEPAIALGVEP